jgi:hypothetical protein
MKGGSWVIERNLKRLLRGFEEAGGNATLAELAAASGMRRQTVSTLLNSAGISLQRNKHLGVERKVAEMRMGGLSDAEIAAITGWSRKSVQQIASRARRHGIEVPYRGNWA